MAQRILFLDIDGVLNSERSCLAFGGYPHSFAEAEIARFDPVALSMVRKLCAKAECSIVLSSSWRTMFTVGEAASALKLPIVAATPDYGSTFSRADEIAGWLAANPGVTKYAIVDDMALDWPDSTHGANFVQTNPDIGLTAANYRHLLRLLSPDCY
jgi:hypothetical protein